MNPERPPTTFESKVFDALHLIPRGRVATYGELARYLECRSPRAIGQALRRNPFAPETPCHRVVAADLSIGGFSGSREGAPIEQKIRILRSEGVRIEANGKIDPSCAFRFDE